MALLLATAIFAGNLLTGFAQEGPATETGAYTGASAGVEAPPSDPAAEELAALEEEIAALPAPDPVSYTHLLADGLGDPVDGVVVADQVVLDGGHLDEPGVAGVVDEGGVAAPAEGVAVLKLGGGEQQAPLVQILQDFLAVSYTHLDVYKRQIPFG